MSVAATPALYESLLRADRPIAWWGLDTADPTVDDSGNGYTLTTVGAPANAPSLLTRGDDGQAGARDFNGFADAYYTAGSVTAAPDGPPSFHAAASSSASSATASILSPAGIRVGDLMLVVLVHATASATISAAPAGWTQVGSTLNAGTHAVALYRKTADSSDTYSQTYAWTWSSSASTLTGMVVYRGLDTAVAGLIYDAGAQVTSSGVLHLTTTETHPDQARQLAIWTGNFSGTLTPESWTANKRLTADASNLKIRAVDYVQASAGSGQRSASSSAATTLGAILVTFGAPPTMLWDRLDQLSATASIHAIVRTDTVAAGVRSILRKHQAYGLRLNGATLEFVYRDGGGVDRTVSGPTLAAGTTYHLVCVDDGTAVHFWVDGRKTSVARAGAAGYQTNTNRVVIGALYDGSSYSEFWDGRLDEVAVWSSALSEQMVRTYYEAYSSGTFGVQLLGAGIYPRLKLEIAWASPPTADCPVYEDVTRFCRSLGFTRGRNMELDRIEAGQLNAELDNRDRRFEPDYSGSPYYPNVIPTRWLRLRAQAKTDGPVYPLFCGFAEGHSLRRSHMGHDDSAVFTAVDTLRALASDQISETTVRPTETAGSRLAAVLRGVAGLRYAGETGAEVIGDDLRNLRRLDHAQAVAETDGGILFAAADGTITFHDRHHRVKTERSVRATFAVRGEGGWPVTRLEPQIDESRLFTAAAVTPASGVVQAVEDATGQAQYFRRTKDLATLHARDSDARAMAEAYAHRYATPRVRIPEVELAPASTPGMWQVVLPLEIGHRIATVDRPVGGGSVTREHFVEGIRHDVSPVGWLVTLSVSPAELEGEYWLLGTGKLGQSTGLESTRLGW